MHRTHVCPSGVLFLYLCHRCMKLSHVCCSSPFRIFIRRLCKVTSFTFIKQAVFEAFHLLFCSPLFPFSQASVNVLWISESTWEDFITIQSQSTIYKTYSNSFFPSSASKTAVNSVRNMLDVEQGLLIGVLPDTVRSYYLCLILSGNAVHYMALPSLSAQHVCYCLQPWKSYAKYLFLPYICLHMTNDF